MKSNVFFYLFLTIAGVLFFTSCEEEKVEPKVEETDILPERFKVDIPDALSQANIKSGNLKSAQADTLNGNEVYEHLNNFIAIGESAADIVESIIFHIRLYGIESVIELTYTSDDDGRVKRLVVESGVNFDDRLWDYQLTITDVEHEPEADGGIGMQVFWNGSPIEGVALIKPSNLNTTDKDEMATAMYSVEYSEKGMVNYESFMVVQISDLPMPSAQEEPFAVNTLKMFVGKNGDVVDVYGNSNHPNGQFFTDKTGFNWAFVASGNQSTDIGVAEVGLPPSTLNSTDRQVILKEYSVKNVLTNEITNYFLDTYGVRPDSSDLANYLENTGAPGYFNADGFIQGGTAPGSEYEPLEINIEALIPYNPQVVSQLNIAFSR